MFNKNLKKQGCASLVSPQGRLLTLFLLMRQSARSARDGQCHVAADDNQIDKEELEEGESEALDAAQW